MEWVASFSFSNLSTSKSFFLFQRAEDKKLYTAEIKKEKQKKSDSAQEDGKRDSYEEAREARGKESLPPCSYTIQIFFVLLLNTCIMRHKKIER